MDSVEAVQEAVPLDTSSSSAYARPVTNVPEPSTSLPGIICRTLCCGNKAAAHDEPTRSFPRNPREFEVGGVAWINAVMAERLGGKNVVTGVEVCALGAQGLLSELCLAKLTYRDAVPAGADLPAEVVVKFAPAELQTQLTMNIFLLSKSEYLAYKTFHATLPPTISTPICFGADFNFTVSGLRLPCQDDHRRLVSCCPAASICQLTACLSAVC
eukprot:COSAG06_NODE_3289_length_5550_cov_26.579894_7_plen_214_part_00